MPRRRRPPRPGQLADLAPLKIFTQIVVLQIAYYVAAAILLVFSALVAGQTVNLDLLLSWRTIRADNTVGWTVALVWLMDSVVCAVLVLLLIARSKLVLDFASTIHFFHLLTTSVYTHEIPRSLFWWGLQASSLALMTSLGVWACRWRELKPITFGAGNTATTNNATSQGATASRADADGDPETPVRDEESGYGRGRGRGRGRDGAGDYEMVALSDTRK